MAIIKLFIFVMILLLGFSGVAEAKGSGGGSAFKGGFSSQRRPSYSPPPKAPPKNASFGSFGKTGGEQKSTSFQQSQMSKDLTKNAAQANAMKTMDARKAANENTRASHNNGFGGNGNYNAGNNGGGFGDRRSQPQQQVHQTIVHRDSGGFMHGLMWFMLGHSMSQQRTNTVYVPASQNAPVQTAQGGWDAANSNQANGMAMPQQQDVATGETESFFMKALRWILWISLITGVVWVVRKIMGFRKRQFSKTANYSLGS